MMLGVGLLRLFDDLFGASTYRLRYKGTDVLVSLLSGLSDKLMRFTIKVADNPVRKSYVAAATAFAGRRFLSHVLILVGVRSTPASLVNLHHVSTPATEPTVGK